MVGDQRIAAFLTQGSTTDGAAWGGDYSVDPINNELLLNEFNSLSIGFTHKFTPKLYVVASMLALLILMIPATMHARILRPISV